jgi:hypothetical protein
MRVQELNDASYALAAEAWIEDHRDLVHNGGLFTRPFPGN